jgi:hypothetical protein
LDTTLEVERRLKGDTSAIHVMDREGDIYDVLSTLVTENLRFVVRAMANRLIATKDPEIRLLWEALEGLKVRYRDTVTVGPRRAAAMPDQARAHPSREGRDAELCVTATTVTLRRSRNAPRKYPETTTLNVVHLFEPNAPPDERPVEWVLLTNEPISTEQEIKKVVGIYRQRWLVEEYFKAIKTGCAFEKRQLQSYHALRNCLAMTLPIAWGMLLLRAQSRTKHSTPANGIVDPFRLRVIRAHAKRYPLPEHPTLLDVAHAVAGMGGYLRQKNKPPGWQTLRRGLERLLTLEEGWLMSMDTCDQP